MDLKAYQRDCLLGTLSGLLMLAGDLCLSAVPYTAGDSGLFAREAYLTGGFQVWRLPPLPDGIDVPGTEIHIFYALKMGEKYRARYTRHFAHPVIHEQDMQHEELLACHPGEWAYDLFAEGIDRKADRALCAAVERLIAPSDAVLECACGTGLLMEVMAPRCRSLVATDFSEKMLKRAEKKCGGRGLQAGVHPGYLQTVFCRCRLYGWGLHPVRRQDPLCRGGAQKERRRAGTHKGKRQGGKK